MTVYQKHYISQKKIKEKIEELTRDGCLNATTWEIIDFTREKKEMNLVKLHYKFIMINKEISHSYIIKTIWATYYWYLSFLINKLHTDNSISYELLWLNKSWLNKLKAALKKEWIVKFWKFGNMRTWKYFLNPLFSSYSWTVDRELYDMFKEDNKNLFWINLL